MLDQKEIFQEAAQVINDLIPEEWNKVYLYVEGWEDFSTEYFYYDPADGRAPVLSHQIPTLFDLDEEEFEDREFELAERILDLQDAFKELGQEPWTSLTFILECNGQFHVEYGYENLRDVEMVEQREAWKAKYGIESK
ncbi:antitoxin YezG family protein [Bhargavaea ginsengi]|uniref:immunity protein YezG family protein n=1 Tax=Bhargavaea ginsengi TaxID=426757 RepID=UPI00203DD9E3|nr:immunity protein YezG family protein [Bhargavaea ginsengi]MCM3087670.1 antitoxin YezG family protein [Bhargavaea ginsengi]